MRPRPFATPDEVRLLVSAPHSYAFPSGHTTSAFGATSGAVLAARRLLRRVPLWGWAMLPLAVAISYSRIYVGEVASKAVAAARAGADGRVSIEYAAPPRGVYLVALSSRMEAAWRIRSRSKADLTARGGTVVVRVGGKEDRVFLEVSDTGVGIPEGKQPLVFERFYRLDGIEEPGNGLGLSIAQTIAEAHGGRIEAESQPGEGTRMTIILPLLSGETQGR